ncbi:hypothetical protein WG66_007009 [Moniliophthora roreri]|nr:hypothetical protein WG66_007009 [Moniliophthora roreri]
MHAGDTVEQLPLWLLFLDNTYWSVTIPTLLFQAFTRSVGVAYFIVGCTLCSMAVKGVKKTIRQPRPVVIDRRSGKPRRSYGGPLMPQDA